MKVIKRLLFFLCAMCAVITVSACVNEKTIIEKEVIDNRYTPERQEVVTDYKYEWSWWQGDFVLVPDVHTEIFPEKYEILYCVTYDDGTTKNLWEQVTKEQYYDIIEKEYE